MSAGERSGAQALAKEEVLSRLSHELRTPLNSVIGFSRMLTNNRAGNQSARDLVMLESIRANGERLLDLVEDLFDVTGRSLEHPPALLPMNVVAAAEVAIGHSLPVARAKDIGLELRVEAATDGLLSLDAARLIRVLRKLIGNAVKFTVRGGVVVTVRVHAGRPTAIEIRDTGIGIPVALQASVFEPFVQGDVGTCRSHEGAGLGLPVARGLAESMNCRLAMESEPGVGSQFTLVLPG